MVEDNLYLFILSSTVELLYVQFSHCFFLNAVVVMGAAVEDGAHPGLQDVDIAVSIT